MESVIGKNLDADEVHLNNSTISCLTPEVPLCPKLPKLFLQEKSSFSMLPPSFFEHMPVLKVLDLSHTSIQSLPASISKLCLLENFILRECSLLMEIPPEIGAVKNLKVFDLEGTEIMYLPKEIGKLETLECLRVSLSAYADEFQDKNGIEHIIPRMTISKLTKLKELSISVDPEAKWWEVEVLEAIMHDLLVLPDLKSLRLCLPTTKLVQQFLSLERYQVPIFSGLWNFRFMIGHCEQLPFSVQLDMEENFLKLEKCIKYMNGEGCMDENAELVRQARALYLRRHWTIEKLSVFDIRRLQYCLLMECNEMQTLVHQEDIFEDRNKAANHGEEAILGSLQFLAIHFMKKLQRICTGPIGRKGLSCLRVLALHTCPELTSIFTGCLLDNFENLTELIVEDCPKVKSLVTLEGTSWSKGPFLPNLKRVSLLDLPGLVSISSGVCIAPHLDTLLVFNCMSLDYLSIMELPRCTKVIKGETEWWDALKYGKLTWNSVFVQLKRDGGLMDQLAEDMNSLQHFLELPLVPTHPGSSLQVDQNSSRNDHPWCNYQDIDLTEDWELVEPLQIDHNVPSFDEFQDTTSQKILNSDDDTQSQYAGTAVRIWESPCPVSGKPHNEETECDFEVPSQKDAFPKKKSFGVHRRRKKVKVTKKMVSEEHLDDGYIWRKYGQKEILGSKYPRSYYRCSLKHLHGCGATKQVQRSTENPSVFKATYHGNHTCPRNLPTNCSSLATKSASTTSRIRDSSTPKEPASTINDSHFQLPTSPLAVDSTNKKSFDVYKRRKSVKATTKMVIEEHLDDGYIWRKYGQKETLGSKYPRQYYRCSLKFEHGCRVTKQVQRFTENPSVFEVTYFGNHTCPRKLHTKFSSLATETASTTSRIRDSSTPTESASTINDSHFQLATSPQAVDSTNKRCISFRRPKNSARQHDLFEESLKAAGLPRFDNGAKLHVSNLDVGVTTEDIRELFSEIGEVKRYAIHYDKNGRSSGSAEVLFAQRSDAFQALKRYNNVQLDGRPMKIEIEVSNPEIPPSAPTLRNNSSTRKPKWTTQVRVISKSGFEKPPDDGYRWKKYGQKQVKGGDSRGYYRCTSCNTKKRVERSSDDPSILEITYQGVHTCLGLSITSDSTTVTKSALSTLENSDTTSTAAVSALSILTTAGSASTVTEDSFGLDSIKNMSGNASIQNWNAVKNKIQSSFSPPFELKSSSSVTSEANPRAILEAVRNNSMNLLSTTKTPEIATESPLPASMRDKSSVVSESYEHIDFLHNQVRALITPQETKQGEEEQQLEYVQLPKQDLRSQGLCLVPVSRASPTVGEPLDEYR